MHDNSSPNPSSLHNAKKFEFIYFPLTDKTDLCTRQVCQKSLICIFRWQGKV